MTDVYGGSAWYAQQLQAVIAAAVQQFQREQATGYVQVNGNAGNERDQALQSIYTHRYDIEQFYNENWGEGVGTPIQRVENWLSITTEDVGDPIAYATESGWFESASDGDRVPTIEQNRYESDLEHWESEFARQNNLDMEAIRQWEDTFQRQLGLDEAAIDQWQQQHDMQLQAQKDARDQWQSEFLRIQGLDEQAASQWTQQFEFQLTQWNESTRQWHEEFLREQGLDDEGVRQWNLTS